jgi:uncharacterized membrane protein YbhN (UPF0104 family)
MRAKKYLTLTKYLLSILILFYISKKVDLTATIQRLSKLEIWQILLVTTASFALLSSQTLRLHALISPFVQSLTTTFRLSFVSLLFSNFLPGGMAGDFYKILCLKRKNASTTDALTFIAADRITGLLFFLVAGGIILLAYPEYQAMMKLTFTAPFEFSMPVFLPVTAGATFGLLYYNKSIRNIFSKILNAFATVSSKRMLLFWLYSFLTFFVRILNIYIIVRLFVPEFQWQHVILIIFVIHVVALIPTTVGSLGVMEGSLIVVLNSFGVPLDAGTSIAIVYRLSIWFLSICGLVIWLSSKKESRLQSNPI